MKVTESATITASIRPGDPGSYREIDPSIVLCNPISGHFTNKKGDLAVTFFIVISQLTVKTFPYILQRTA